jgi:hypothetical protein
MEILGDYQTNGYALVRELISPEVARAFMASFKKATGGGPIPMSKLEARPAVLQRPAFDVSSQFFQPMEFFLWGLTPAIGQILGRELLPTYNYFRIYREGDICKVHSDRPSSQHGVSLTLDYSDGEVWDLQVGKKRTESLYPLSDDFGGDAYESLGMRPGDAVLYQASHYPHGRMTPNPNVWSAHLFLFFVDKDGPYRNHAFDEQLFEPVNFTFV